jgi:hypothetical protein
MNPSANHTATPAGIIGMPGWFASEQVAGFDRNRWLVSSEYARDFAHAQQCARIIAGWAAADKSLALAAGEHKKPGLDGDVTT